jgi:hypothetical protein
MNVILVAALVLLAGCAGAVETPTSSSPASPSASAVPSAAPTAKAPPPPLPQVGTCDLTIDSAGTGTGAVRDNGCAVSAAIPDLDAAARVLLVEVTWDNLGPGVLQLRSSVENPAACGPPGVRLPSACSELASNMSVERPVRLVLAGDAFAKFAANATVFESVYQGAAAQQTFHIAFSAFRQEAVPVGYSALA